MQKQKYKRLSLHVEIVWINFDSEIWPRVTLEDIDTQPSTPQLQFPRIKQ